MVVSIDDVQNRLATMAAGKLLGTATVLMSGRVCIDTCIDICIDICIGMCMCGADEWQCAIARFMMLMDSALATKPYLSALAEDRSNAASAAQADVIVASHPAWQSVL